MGGLRLQALTVNASCPVIRVPQTINFGLSVRWQKIKLTDQFCSSFKRCGISVKEVGAYLYYFLEQKFAITHRDYNSFVITN